MIQAFGENIIVKIIEKEEAESKTTSGLILVSDFDDDLPRGEVMNKGADVPDWINAGDVVVFHEQFSQRITIDEVDYMFLNYKVLYGKEI